jgi:hypothetical protein
MLYQKSRKLKCQYRGIRKRLVTQLHCDLRYFPTIKTKKISIRRYAEIHVQSFFFFPSDKGIRLKLLY